MGSIAPYETAKGRRYRVRYRKPDRTAAEKRGFTTMREAKLYLSMVTVAKSKGEYIDPVASRVPVRVFADSWLRSKQPPMTKPSYYMTLEQAWKNHVAPVWADREISSIRRSEVQDWVSDLATQKSRTVVIRALGILAGILDVAIDDRRLASNPARHVRSLPRNDPGKCRVYLSHDQVATLAACSGYPTLVLTLACAGPRWARPRDFVCTPRCTQSDFGHGGSSVDFVRAAVKRRCRNRHEVMATNQPPATVWR